MITDINIHPYEDKSLVSSQSITPLCQEKYNLNILKYYLHMDSKPIATTKMPRTISCVDTVASYKISHYCKI